MSGGPGRFRAAAFFIPLLAVMLTALTAPSAIGQVLFEDVTDQAGLTDVAFTWGAAWGDVNQDGWPDLLVGHHFIRIESLFTPLYVSNGDGTFSPLQQFQGDNHGGAFGDVNGDGRQDLYICRGSYHADAVWINAGSRLLYVDPGVSGIVDAGRGRTSSMVDVDLDGDLDIFVTNKLTPNLLWINDGGSRFTDEAQTRGVIGRNDINKVGAWCDFDWDGDMDVFVGVVDGYDHLYRNDGTGSFTDVAAQAGLLTGVGSIDAYWADFDNDLDMDLFVCRSYNGSGLPPLRPLLYVNRGNGTFKERGSQAGITNTNRARQCTAGDFDNDGWIDIYMTCFSSEDGLRPAEDVFFHNNGNGTFTEIVQSDVLADRSLRTVKGLGSVAAASDYNRDGLLDLFVTRGGHYPENGNPGHSLLLKNVSSTLNAWTEVRLKGTASNPHGIGARVLVETDKGRFLREHFGGSHYCSQDEALLHFGLGRSTAIQRIIIKWPGGKWQVKKSPAINQLHEFVEP
jgi:hypothetical protein